ncbi:uncharacterized protein METZ01_LOCUS179326 [marine metagenome]|uniref:Uncharacterized protein n=1 Tax=marine metagenome TaxID=408172 RepID=A0A382CL09_9ZZZZ
MSERDVGTLLAPGQNKSTGEFIYIRGVSSGFSSLLHSAAVGL